MTLFGVNQDVKNVLKYLIEELSVTKVQHSDSIKFLVMQYSRSRAGGMIPILLTKAGVRSQANIDISDKEKAGDDDVAN